MSTHSIAVTVNGAKVGLNSITSVSEPPAPASNGAGSSTTPSNTADQTSAAAA